MRGLAEGWRAALEGLACHAEQPGAGGHTPSDFPLVGLSQEQVERLEAIVPRAWTTCCRCRRCRKGWLFHALYDAAAPDVYTVQFVAELEGVLEADRLRQAAQALLDRHANLRAAFHHEGLARPVQVIPRAVALPWRELDLSDWRRRSRSGGGRNCWRRTGPNGSCCRARRCCGWMLLRLAAQRHLLVLTSHHILMDGWSMPVFFSELLALYRSGGDSGALPRVRPYADYLAWLARQDPEGALRTWRDYLAGLTARRGWRGR